MKAGAKSRKVSKKRGRGRPPLPEGSKKENRTVTLHPDDLARFEQAMSVIHEDKLNSFLVKAGRHYADHLLGTDDKLDDLTNTVERLTKQVEKLRATVNTMKLDQEAFHLEGRNKGGTTEAAEETVRIGGRRSGRK